MAASLQARAEQLASEFAGQATTAEELSGLMHSLQQRPDYQELIPAPRR